jgi:hypothetical protein
MCTENHDDHPLCPGCRQVVSLIHRAHEAMDREPEPDAFDVIESLPFLLESTLTHLLAGFDYDTNRHSRLGIAVQLLSMAAAQAEGLRAQSDQLRRPVES